MKLSKRKICLIAVLSIVLLCVAGFMWAWFVTRDIRKNVKGALNKSQQVSVKNLILTETKDQKKYWELYAKTGSYDSGARVVVLTEIMGNFYNENQEVILSFKAPVGTYKDDIKLVVLNGGESLFVSKDGTSITADKVTWQGKDSDIIAEGNVRILGNKDFSTVSEKAVFNSDLTIFKIIGNAKTNIYNAGEESKSENTSLFQKGK